MNGATLTSPYHAPVQGSVPVPAGQVREMPFRSGPHWRSRLESAGRGVAAIAILYSPYYLVWRATTLNSAAPWFSIPLFAGEILAAVMAGLVVFERWRLRRRVPAEAPRRSMVDVYVVARGEPLDAIRRSALAARSITYPHRTCLLDADRRSDVKAMARELGIDHIANPEPREGNDVMSRAIRLTRGEFVLVVDAGVVPLPHVIDRLLGYFAEDPRLAFAQPAVERVGMAGSASRPGVPDTVSQQGRDRMNAVLLTGGCSLLRRRAIEDLHVPAMAIRPVEASLHLHAKGWRGAYHHEPVAWCPVTDGAGAGARPALAVHDAVLLRGLTLSQRVAFLSWTLRPLAAVVRLVSYLAPVVLLASGMIPVRAFDTALLIRFVPFVLLWLAALRLLSRGSSARPWWRGELEGMRRVFADLRACGGLVFRHSATRAGPRGQPMRLAPHIALFVMTVGAMAFAVAAWLKHWIGTGATSALPTALLVGLAWAGWNASFAVQVLRDGRRRERRPEHRQEEMFPVRYRVLNRVRAARWQTGLTENLSPRGLAYRSLEVAPVGTRLSLLLRLTTTTVGVTGRVVHVRRETAGGVTFFRHGVRFEAVADLAREAILIHVSLHAAPLAGERSAISDRALLPARDRRGDARTPIALPAELVVHEPDGQLVDELAVLEDVSPAGARVVTERRIALGATVRFHVPGSGIDGAGSVAHVTPVTTPLGERYIVGLSDVVGLTPPRELVRPARARVMRAGA